MPRRVPPRAAPALPRDAELVRGVLAAVALDDDDLLHAPCGSRPTGDRPVNYGAAPRPRRIRNGSTLRQRGVPSGRRNVSVQWATAVAPWFARSLHSAPASPMRFGAAERSSLNT